MATFSPESSSEEEKKAAVKAVVPKAAPKAGLVKKPAESSSDSSGRALGGPQPVGQTPQGPELSPGSLDLLWELTSFHPSHLCRLGQL